jgi:general secretion pathway protein A
MYENFYGFKQKPFQLLPDPTFLYRSKKHDIALTHLEYGIFDRTGFIVITGEVGTGKTTLLRYMLKTLDCDLPIAFLSQTYLKPEEFLRAVCQEFSLPHEGKGKTELLELFGRFLIEQYENGRYVILVLDEAQNLPFETLEEIRMLSNLDAENELLLQIILVGQPNLRRKLRWEGLSQLSQRVQVSYHLPPLEPEEVKDYIRHRIQKAGGPDPNLFDEGATRAIYEYSGGVPRLVNSLCHMCLVYGMADELERIDQRLVRTVVEDRAGWDLSSGNASFARQDANLEPPGPIEMGNRDRTWARLESKLDRMIEISEASKNAFQLIASALSGMAGHDEIMALQEKIMLEMSGREALQQKLAQLEKRLDDVIRSHQQLMRLFTERREEPGSRHRGKPRTSLCSR